MQQRLHELDAASFVDRLVRRLSPMGNLVLSGANWDLLQAESASRVWSDAGMISLAFFRVLELEFNERLILPMVKTLNFDAPEFGLAALADDTSKGKKTVEFWRRMLGCLKKAQTERKGLEIGPLEMLLQKVADVNGPDGHLRAIIHSAIGGWLSPAGLDAFKSGELANFLDPIARDRFRNPGAHARYVDLDTARECRQYVEGALKKLNDYCDDGAVSGQTIH